MIGGLHCPCCGTTDALDWHQSVGSPEVLCSDCEEFLVDGCEPECEHDDPLQEGPRMATPQIKVGDTCRLAPGAKTTNDCPTAYDPSTTLVHVQSLDNPWHGPGNAQVTALDGLRLGLCQVVALEYLTPVAVLPGTRWRIDASTIRNVGGGGVYFHPTVTVVEVVYPPRCGGVLVRVVDGADPAVAHRDRRNGTSLRGRGETQYVDVQYLTIPAEISTIDTTKESTDMASATLSTGTGGYELSVATVLAKLRAHRAELEAAHDARIAERQEENPTPEEFGLRVAEYHTAMGALVAAGELRFNEYGELDGWADRNRTDDLPAHPERDPGASSRVIQAEGKRVRDLALQDKHIAFLETVGSETVYVDRATHDAWFVVIPA